MNISCQSPDQGSMQSEIDALSVCLQSLAPSTLTDIIPQFIIQDPLEFKEIPCSGLIVQWKPGSIWSTYPYHQHAVKAMDWIPTAFNPDENEIVLRSIRCIEKVTKNTVFDFKACPECRSIEYSSDFKNFLGQAIEASKCTPWDYLTFVQVKELLAVMTKEIHKLHVKIENYKIEIESEEDYSSAHD